MLGVVDDRALGGSLRIVVTDRGSLAAAKAAVDEVVGAIDLAASRFRDDSELSRLNAAPEREVVVGPLLAQAIAAGLRGAEVTGGAVDPTIGTAIKIAGYDADFATIAKEGGPIHVHAARVPGWQAIRFDPRARRVWIPKGVEIDLGATAKALASDLAAGAAAKTIARGGVLVSFGGDIAVAGEAPPGGWSIQVSEDSGAPIAEGQERIAIADGGVASSSTTVRRWRRGGVVLHHIIDPATGLPVEGRWRTATVAAATCVDANIASTAAIVLAEGALPWLEAQGLAARLVDQTGSVACTSWWPKPADSKLRPNNF